MTEDAHFRTAVAAHLEAKGSFLRVQLPDAPLYVNSHYVIGIIPADEGSCVLRMTDGGEIRAPISTEAAVAVVLEAKGEVPSPSIIDVE